MADTKAKDGAPPAKADVEPAVQPTTPAEITVQDIRRNVQILEKAVELVQTRLTARVLRNNTIIRRGIAPKVLTEAVRDMVPESSPTRQTMLDLLAKAPANSATASAPAVAQEAAGEAMDVEAGGGAAAAEAPSAPLGTGALPEVEVYLSTLVLTTLLRRDMAEEARELSTQLVARVLHFNRRTLDLLASKVYFYYSVTHERTGRLPEVRPQLLAIHRTCCLRHDEIGQATVLNLLLRNLLSQNLLDQAAKLVAKVNFPEGVSNNQFCRYLYYVGRINALQLDYSDAFTKLSQSGRKAPQNTALSFRVSVQKLLVIVQLLLGEIPERTVFNQQGSQKPLEPYLHLTQAVRMGDLAEFNKRVQQYADVFRADHTFTLIQRLAHNVIKTGLRKINVSYSHISLEDVCSKVRLDNVSSAEFVCGKAIKDGVINATIDHDKGAMRSQEIVDVYATDAPQQAFHTRITFCLDVHNEAVKAMRYAPNAYKKELERSRAAKDEKTDEELAQELEEEMDEGGI